MILVWLLVILLVAGVLAAVAARWNTTAARYIALVAILADLALTIPLWITSTGASPGVWLRQIDRPWLPQFGIDFHLALDGLSLLLLILTFFLGALAVLASWTEITEAVGFFHLNVLWTLAGITGVFLAADLFLFYFAWELMLVPMYFLIAVWGHENRVYAATKFFLFTQFSGLLMLVAILALYFLHQRATGIYSFQYSDLLGTALPPKTAMWLMLGFFIAFAVKMPVFPLHTWLPDAHTEAPTAGSVLLAGLLLKTGAYGMLRFVLPLFPDAAHAFAPVALTLGSIGILYGALLAFGQTDLKRLVAYTSVSHLGFVLVGIFAGNTLALQGALLTMICHGVSTGALFILVGALQQRIHSRDIQQMGGLWTTAPRFGGATLFFMLASIGLPGLGDFVGEFLVLFGAYQRSIALAVIAAIGVLVATLYGLRMLQKAFYGPEEHHWRFPDLVRREGLIVGVMAAALLVLGLYPQPLIRTFGPAMDRLAQLALAPHAETK
jgi:NADH-quinone oxidoreductase subunit M